MKFLKTKALLIGLASIVLSLIGSFPLLSIESPILLLLFNGVLFICFGFLLGRHFPGEDTTALVFFFLGATVLPIIGVVSYINIDPNNFIHLAFIVGISLSTIVISGFSITGYALGQSIQFKELKKLKDLESKAQKGDPQSQFLLGLSFQLGQINPIDDRKAIEWYRKAVDQGHSSAINNLGIMYQFGKGVTENNAESLICYQKAIEKGSLDAYVNLGHCYEEGLGVELDCNKAYDLYLTAAEKGFSLAMLNLGLMNWKGNDVPTDLLSAYMWIKLADIYSLSQNKEIRTESQYYEAVLQNKMTSDQISLSEELVRKWKESHPIPVTA